MKLIFILIKGESEGYTVKSREEEFPISNYPLEQTEFLYSQKQGIASYKQTYKYLQNKAFNWHLYLIFTLIQLAQKVAISSTARKTKYLIIRCLVTGMIKFTFRSWAMSHGPLFSSMNFTLDMFISMIGLFVFSSTCCTE